MSKRTICTCDMCGKDVEPVFEVNLGFGERARSYYTIYSLPPQLETFRGDACNTCMRKLIEELRSRFNLEYKLNE